MKPYFVVDHPVSLFGWFRVIKWSKTTKTWVGKTVYRTYSMKKAYQVMNDENHNLVSIRNRIDRMDY